MSQGWDITITSNCKKGDEDRDADGSLSCLLRNLPCSIFSRLLEVGVLSCVGVLVLESTASC